MNLVWGALIIAAVAAPCVAAMLLVRRRAPDGSFFADGDRAAGVFGVLATGFSVLVGFVVFLAFTSYDKSRVGAEQESLALGRQIETAQFFPAPVAAELTGELVCYGRSVVHLEWPQAEAGRSVDEVNSWGIELFRTVRLYQPKTAVEESAYDKWLDHTAEREEARIDRAHGAVGVIPSPLWVVLILLAIVIIGYTLFFADSGERALSQGVLMGTVATTLAAMLLLVQFLDSPFKDGVGGIQPVAMERILRTFDEALVAVDRVPEPPCDEQGRAS
ncbi:MAG TPA: hypothetical protein VE440_05465 [Gaiellaceae bacterium]|jgi:hypothetical protein|nr:hypothetical protein [Gaiellaceae bacterium]